MTCLFLIFGPVTRWVASPNRIRDVDAYHAEVAGRGVPVVDPLTTHWWGDQSFRVKDPYGYSIWFAQTVAESQPPEGVEAV